MSSPRPDDNQQFDLDEARDRIAAHFGVPTAVWKKMLKQESGDDPSAVSPKGARNEWQFMPATSKAYKVNESDPLDRARGAMQYLSENYRKFRKYAKNEKHAWMASVAGYHTNPKNVEEDFKKGGYGLPNISDGSITTRDHVLKIFDGLDDVYDRNPFDAEKGAYSGGGTGAPKPSRASISVNVGEKTPPKYPDQSAVDAWEKQYGKLPAGARSGMDTEPAPSAGRKLNPFAPPSTPRTSPAPTAPGPFTLKTDDGDEWTEAVETPKPGMVAKTLAPGQRRLVSKKTGRFAIATEGEKADDGAGNITTSYSIAPEMAEKPADGVFTLKAADGTAYTEKPPQGIDAAKLKPIPEGSKRLWNAKTGKPVIATKGEEKDEEDGSKSISYSLQGEDGKPVTRAVRRESSDVTIRDEAREYSFERTGKLKLQNGTELTFLRDGEAPAGMARLQDADGETYLFDKQSGKLEDESLKEAAKTYPLALVPYEQKNAVPVRAAQENQARQVAAQLEKDYDSVDAEDAYDWLLERGFTDITTGAPLPDDRYYQSEEKRNAAARAALQPNTSLGAPGAQTKGEPDDTYTITRRDLRDVAQYSLARQKEREAAVLTMIERGETPPAEVLKKLRVDPDKIDRDAMQMAITKGKVASDQLNQIIPKFAAQGYDAYQSRILAKKQMGLMRDPRTGKDTADVELAAYDRVKQARAAELIKGPALGPWDRGAEYKPDPTAEAQAQAYVTDYMDSMLSRYGTATAIETAQAAEAKAEEARKQRVAAMGWGEYAASTPGQIYKNINKGLAKLVIAESLRGAVVWTHGALDLLDATTGTSLAKDWKVVDHPWYKAAKTAEDWLDSIFKTNKDLDEEIAQGKVPKAVGTSLAFIFPSLTSKPKAAIALMSTLQMGGGNFHEAIEAGASEEDAIKYALMSSAALGWTETLGISKAFDRLLKGVGGTATKQFFRELVRSAPREITEEVLLNEGPQTVGQNIFARLTFDPDRKWDKGLADSVLTAALSAGLTSSVITGVNSIRDQRAINAQLEADKTNGGPNLRNLGERGLYIYGKPQPVTDELKPLVDYHTELQKDIEEDFAAIAQMRERAASLPVEQRLSLFRTVRAVQERQFEAIEKQEKVAAKIVEKSGVPAPDLLEQKAAYDDVRDTARAESESEIAAALESIDPEALKKARQAGWSDERIAATAIVGQSAKTVTPQNIGQNMTENMTADEQFVDANNLIPATSDERYDAMQAASGKPKTRISQIDAAPPKTEPAKPLTALQKFEERKLGRLGYKDEDRAALTNEQRKQILRDRTLRRDFFRKTPKVIPPVTLDKPVLVEFGTRGTYRKLRNSHNIARLRKAGYTFKNLNKKAVTVTAAPEGTESGSVAGNFENVIYNIDAERTAQRKPSARAGKPFFQKKGVRTLTESVRAAGGIRPDSDAKRRGKKGDLERFEGIPGIVNQNAELNAEEMARMMWESGYLRDVWGNTIDDLNADEFLQILESDALGIARASSTLDESEGSFEDEIVLGERDRTRQAMLEDLLGSMSEEEIDRVEKIADFLSDDAVWPVFEDLEFTGELKDENRDKAVKRGVQYGVDKNVTNWFIDTLKEFVARRPEIGGAAEEVSTSESQRPDTRSESRETASAAEDSLYADEFDHADIEDTDVEDDAPGSPRQVTSRSEQFDAALSELRAESEPESAPASEATGFDAIADLMGFAKKGEAYVDDDGTLIGEDGQPLFAAALSAEQRKTYDQLKEHFEIEYAKLADAGDAAAQTKAFIQKLNDRFTLDQIEKLKPFVVAFLEEQDGLDGSDAEVVENVATDAAHDAATSPENDLPEPTQAQKEAGNYRKGHISVNGLNVSVENPVGSVRSGTDRNGKKWSVTMKQHYGYIKRTTGADEEHIDVFVKDGTPADFAGDVYVIDQVTPDTGRFDEHKVMLGFANEQEARDAYAENYAKSWKGLKAITAMPFDEFTVWVRDGVQDKPVAKKTTSAERYAETKLAEAIKAFNVEPITDALTPLRKDDYFVSEGRLINIGEISDAGQVTYHIEFDPQGKYPRTHRTGNLNNFEDQTGFTIAESAIPAPSVTPEGALKQVEQQDSAQTTDTPQNMGTASGDSTPTAEGLSESTSQKTEAAPKTTSAERFEVAKANAFVGNREPGETLEDGRKIVANVKTKKEAQTIAGRQDQTRTSVEGYLNGKFKSGWLVISGEKNWEPRFTERTELPFLRRNAIQDVPGALRAGDTFDAGHGTTGTVVRIDNHGALEWTNDDFDPKSEARTVGGSIPISMLPDGIHVHPDMFTKEQIEDYEQSRRYRPTFGSHAWLYELREAPFSKVTFKAGVTDGQLRALLSEAKAANPLEYEPDGRERLKSEIAKVIDAIESRLGTQDTAAVKNEAIKERYPVGSEFMRGKGKPWVVTGYSEDYGGPGILGMTLKRGTDSTIMDADEMASKFVPVVADVVSPLDTPEKQAAHYKDYLAAEREESLISDDRPRLTSAERFEMLKRADAIKVKREKTAAMSDEEIADLARRDKEYQATLPIPKAESAKESRPQGAVGKPGPTKAEVKENIARLAENAEPENLDEIDQADAINDLQLQLSILMADQPLGMSKAMISKRAEWDKKRKAIQDQIDKLVLSEPFDIETLHDAIAENAASNEDAAVTSVAAEVAKTPAASNEGEKQATPPTIRDLNKGDQFQFVDDERWFVIERSERDADDRVFVAEVGKAKGGWMGGYHANVPVHNIKPSLPGAAADVTTVSEPEKTEKASRPPARDRMILEKAFPDSRVASLINDWGSRNLDRSSTAETINKGNNRLMTLLRAVVELTPELQKIDQADAERLLDAIWAGTYGAHTGKPEKEFDGAALSFYIAYKDNTRGKDDFADLTREFLSKFPQKTEAAPGDMIEFELFDMKPRGTILEEHSPTMWNVQTRERERLVPKSKVLRKVDSLTEPEPEKFDTGLQTDLFGNAVAPPKSAKAAPEPKIEAPTLFDKGGLDEEGLFAQGGPAPIAVDTTDTGDAEKDKQLAALEEKQRAADLAKNSEIFGDYEGAMLTELAADQHRTISAIANGVLARRNDISKLGAKSKTYLEDIVAALVKMANAQIARTDFVTYVNNKELFEDDGELTEDQREIYFKFTEGREGDAFIKDFNEKINEMLNAPEAAQTEAPTVESEEDDVKPSGPLNESITDYDSFKDFAGRVRKGEVTPEELKASFEAMIENRAVIEESLSKFSIPELKKRFNSYHAQKKAEWVSTGYKSMLKLHLLGEGYSVMYGGSAKDYESKEYDAMRNVIDKITPETIAKYAADVAENMQKRAKMVESVKAAITNPQTFDDFKTFLDYKTEADFTPEQRKLHDEVVAERTLENWKEKKEKEKIVAQIDLEDTELTLTKHFHSKRQSDVWIVTPSDRVERTKYDELNAKAKMLGGRYRPAYKPNNSPAGFNFYTEDAAQQFMALQEGDVDRSERLAERAAQKQMTSLERLRDVAARQREAAEEDLNRDRLVNTARRAGMAANAEARNNHAIAQANTMDRVADAIERGETRYLTDLDARTEFDTLDRMLRRGVQKTETRRIDEDPGYRPQWGRRATEDDITAVEFPYPVLQEGDKGTLQRIGQTVDGVKLAARRIVRDIKFGQPIRNPKAIERVKELYQKLRYAKGSDASMIVWRYQDMLATYNRLLSIGIPNPQSLREALREYLPLRVEPEQPSEIQQLERELVGTKYGRENDYFPTPPELARRVAETADIRAGMQVLEPSAGKGNILDAVREAQPEAEIEAVELLDKLRKITELKGYNLVGHDFADFEPEHSYDRVVMNPPFKDEIEHIRKAYDLLKPGGRLVAITSPSWTYNKSKSAQAFRDWVDEVGGYEEDLPEGSFARGEVATGVHTKLLVIDKGENAPQYNAPLHSRITAAQSDLGFYSGVEQDILDKMPEKASVGQIRGILKDSKAEELEWLDIDSFLATKVSFSKDEVLEFIRANNVELREVTLGEEREPGTVSNSEYNAFVENLAHKYGISLTRHDALGALENAATPEDLEEWDRLEDATVPSDGTEYSSFVLPGGDQYRELLLTLPTQEIPLVPENTEGWTVETVKDVTQFSDQREIKIYDANGKWVSTRAGFRGTDEEAIRDTARSLGQSTQQARQRASKFTSRHWKEANVLAHVRFDSRDDGKTLHIAELQSDWHQAGRREGYRPSAKRIAELEAREKELENTSDAGELKELVDIRRELTEGPMRATPDAPFKKSWPMLAMKRMIRYAADNGYERVTWDVGTTQTDRYDLRKEVDAIHWKKLSSGEKQISVEYKEDGIIAEFTLDKDDRIVGSGFAHLEGKRLDEATGKELAREIVENDGGRLEGENLSVGGEGMLSFYDKILPNEVNKYVKKWGERVETHFISPTEDTQIDVHSLRITPEMKLSVARGQKLFARRSAEAANLLTDVLPKAETHVLLAGIKSQMIGDDLELTPHAAETLRRLEGEIEYQNFSRRRTKEGADAETIEREFDEQYPSHYFTALTNDANSFRILAQVGRSRIADFEAAGYTDEDLAGYNELLANLETLAAAAEDFGVAYVFDEDLPEEHFHQEDLRGGRTDQDALTELAETELWQNPGMLFTAEYPELSPADKASEIAAKLATDQGEKYGWDKRPNFAEEKEIFLKTWADGVVRRNKDWIESNGVDAFVDRFERIAFYAKIEKSDSSGSDSGKGSKSSRKRGTRKRPTGRSHEANAGRGEKPNDNRSAATRSLEQERREAVALGVDVANVRIKNRKFAETLRDNGRDDVADVPYIPGADIDRIREAKDIMRESVIAADDNAFATGDYDYALEQFFDPDLHPRTRTVLGIALIDHLGSAGDLELMNQVAGRVIEHVGEAAQAVQAASIACKYDFARGVMLAKRALESHGKQLTQEHIDELKKATSKLAATQREKALIAKMLEDAETVIAEQQEEIEEIRTALAEAVEGMGLSDAERAKLEAALEESIAENAEKDGMIENLKRQLARWRKKSLHPTATTAGGGASKTYRDLAAELPAIKAALAEAFPGKSLKAAIAGENAPLRSAITDHEDFDDEKREQVVKYFAYRIFEGDSYKEVLDAIADLTDGILNPDEIRAIHSDAEAMTHGEKAETTDDAKVRRASRREHERFAKAYRKDAGLDETEPAKRAKRTVSRAAGAEKFNKLDRKVLELAGDDDQLGVAAILYRLAKSASDWYDSIARAYPDLDAAAQNDLFVRARKHRDKAVEALKAELAAKRGLIEDVTRDYEQFKKENLIAASYVRKHKATLDRLFKKLSKSDAEQNIDLAIDILSTPKTMMSTGEISYIGRQGFLPLVLFTGGRTKDGELVDGAVKSLLGVVKGLSSDVNRAIYEETLRNHRHFDRAQYSGTIFSQIGDFNAVDEHFAGRAFQKAAESGIPVVSHLGKAQLRFEHAYTLPGDAQRLFISSILFDLIDDQNLAEYDRLKADKMAAKIANAFTGKSNLEFFKRNNTITKLINLLGFAPSYVGSRFEASFYLSPLGLLKAPKGLRMMMLRKQVRFHTVMFALAMAALFTLDAEGDDDERSRWDILDPASKSFLKGRIRGTDQKFDLTANMSEPMRLFFYNAVGSGYYAVRGEWNKLGDIWRQERERYLYTDSGQALRYFRGKLSPTASFALDTLTGKDYIGRDVKTASDIAWAAAERFIPLTYKQTFDALTMDSATELMRPGLNEQKAQQWRNIKNGDLSVTSALTVFMSSALGANFQDYAEVEKSRAEMKAWELYEGFSSKKTTAEQREINAGLRKIYRYREELARRGQSTELIDRRTNEIVRRYGITEEAQKAIKGQATGSRFAFVTKRMAPEQIEMLIDEYATAKEKPELQSILAAKQAAAAKKDEPPKPLIERVANADTEDLAKLYKRESSELTSDQRFEIRKKLKQKASDSYLKNRMSPETYDIVKDVLGDEIKFPRPRPKAKVEKPIVGLDSLKEEP